MANYLKYSGYDISEKVIAICKEKFLNDLAKEFEVITTKNTSYAQAELILSVDVLFNLIEDDVFKEYMNRLFKTSTKYVIIYSSNYEASIASHVRCREFAEWIATNVSNIWELHQKNENQYPFNEGNPQNTLFADFYIYK